MFLIPAHSILFLTNRARLSFYPLFRLLGETEGRDSARSIGRVQQSILVSIRLSVFFLTSTGLVVLLDQNTDGLVHVDVLSVLGR